MRITNKIMQNNSIANINTNKLLQDKLNTQITTQSKIVRPSDDPVVAIRALRLRSNLSQITQYYEKNLPDAKSWLAVTEGALDTMSKVMTDMYANCEKGAKGSLKPEDRKKILEDLKALGDEVYATGDADYAGKNIFTGYRTNVRLSFQGKTELPYTITEQLTKEAIDSFSYVDTQDLKKLNDANFGDPALDASEETINSEKINRIRLAYDKMSNTDPTIKLKTVDATGNVSYKEMKIGTPPTAVKPETISQTATPSPYDLVKANPDKVYFVPETGELLLGKNVNDAMQQLPKNQEIAITYEKKNWEKGDLRPEHYFAATANKGTPEEIQYNPEYLTNKKDTDLVKQVISYDVGFNQEMRVNTLAGECFTHNIGRDVDEIVAATQDVIDMEAVVADLESMLKSDAYTDVQKGQIQERLDAAKKAYTLLEDKCQKLFEGGMTKMQGYLDQTTLASTNVGSRAARLEMVGNRLKSQQTSFMELTSDNEGADITELAIQLKSAKLSYDAALMATGQIVQNSLMNFI